MLSWRDRIRERRRRPADPGEFLAGTLAIAILLGLVAFFLVLYPAINKLRIGYLQPHAQAILLAFSLALPTGVAVGYALLRRLLPKMARGEPITRQSVLLRAILDLFIFTSALWVYLWIALPPFGEFPRDPTILDLTEVLVAVWVGYLLGASVMRAAAGLLWLRSQKAAASAGSTPIGP